MTTLEMIMWAATALNAGGACYYAWLIRRHNRLNGNLVDMSKALIEALENELQKRVELTMDVMRLTSERNELRDAAKFEARVAKRLTGGLWIFGFCSKNCPWNRMDPKDSFSCVDEKRGMKFCRLRDARCWVEKEMDG